MRIVRTLCAAALVAASTGAASADMYLCTVKAKYGRITIGPELAIEVFEDRGTARVLDGVIHSIQQDATFAKVEKRPALTRVSWVLRLRVGNSPQHTRDVFYSASIMPDGRAIINATVEVSNIYKRSTGHCKVSKQNFDDLGNFGTKLDRPLRGI